MNKQMNEQIKEHESYGLLSIARGQCSDGVSLFGSSIKHRKLITLEIHSAEIKRSLNNDYYHPKKLLISIDMSPTQFAEAITTLNVGTGAPITLRFVNGRRLSNCPFENKVAQFNSEFSNDMKDLGKKADATIDMIKTLCSLPRVTKGQLNELYSLIVKLRQDIKDDIPFVNKQFTEQMEKTINEAKGEIESFITSAIHQTGLKTLQTKAPQLEFDKFIEVGENK